VSDEERGDGYETEADGREDEERVEDVGGGEGEGSEAKNEKRGVEEGGGGTMSE
jgi:hypothetical protein